MKRYHSYTRKFLANSKTKCKTSFMEESVGVFTEAEYLEYDLRSELKNENINGKVIPKIGKS